MSTRMIQDAHWSKIVRFLHNHPRAAVGDEAACRRFVEAVRWIGRTIVCQALPLEGKPALREEAYPSARHSGVNTWACAHRLSAPPGDRGTCHRNPCAARRSSEHRPDARYRGGWTPLTHPSLRPPYTNRCTSVRLDAPPMRIYYRHWRCNVCGDRVTDEQPPNEESTADQPAIDPRTVGALVPRTQGADAIGMSDHALRG